MSTPTNYIDAGTQDNTAKAFNNYDVPDYDISSNTDAMILGFFQKLAGGNKEAAKAMASAMILTAKAQNIKPEVALDAFRKLHSGQLSAAITGFMNASRVGTSYLGLSNSPKQNQYVLRSIVP